MKEINGVHVFDDEDLKSKTHPALKALSNLSFGDVFFPYGFSLAQKDGKTRISPNSAEDYLAELEILNADGPVASRCYDDSPNTCKGLCSDFGLFCKKVYNPKTGNYYCACVNA